MYIECPKCDEVNDLDSDDLPANACDSTDYKCVKCKHVFQIGWCAEAELR